MIEDKTSGKILAQAETWQAVDSRMLIFDNIEFADDRQVDQFAPVLAKWCEESPYPDILMGNGYNKMANTDIRLTKGIVPPMTSELNGLLANRQNAEWDMDEWSDESIPYTDADESCSVLKYNSTVEPYFKKAYDNYVQEHGELPEIGSFFSEPSEEDLAALRHEEASTEDTYVMVDGDRMEDLEGEHEADAPEVAGRCEDVENEKEGFDSGEDLEL